MGAIFFVPGQNDRCFAAGFEILLGAADRLEVLVRWYKKLYRGEKGQLRVAETLPGVSCGELD